jgi:hypothetical protein
MRGLAFILEKTWADFVEIFFHLDPDLKHWFSPSFDLRKKDFFATLKGKIT